MNTPGFKPLLRTWQTIVLGGVTVGTLDIIDAIAFWHLRAAVPPSRIFQSIAAGLYGRAAFEGGMRTAIVGGVLHYGIATSIVAVYVMAGRRAPVLIRRPLLCGAGYGLGVLGVMNLIVLPLSGIGVPHWTGAVALNQVLIHLVAVGMVTALICTMQSDQASLVRRS